MLGLERLSQQEMGGAYSWGYDMRRDPWVLGLMLVSCMERRKIVEGIGQWVGLEAWLGSLSFGWTAVLLGVAHIAFCPDRSDSFICLETVLMPRP